MCGMRTCRCGVECIDRWPKISKPMHEVALRCGSDSDVKVMIGSSFWRTSVTLSWQCKWRTSLARPQTFALCPFLRPPTMPSTCRRICNERFPSLLLSLNQTFDRPLTLSLLVRGESSTTRRLNDVARHSYSFTGCPCTGHTKLEDPAAALLYDFSAWR